MPRGVKEPIPLTKHTLHFYEGDVARLQEMFPNSGASVVIRRLIHRFIAEQDVTYENSLGDLEGIEWNSTDE